MRFLNPCLHFRAMYCHPLCHSNLSSFSFGAPLLGWAHVNPSWCSYQSFCTSKPPPVFLTVPLEWPHLNPTWYSCSSYHTPYPRISALCTVIDTPEFPSVLMNSHWFSSVMIGASALCSMFCTSHISATPRVLAVLYCVMRCSIIICGLQSWLRLSILFNAPLSSSVYSLFSPQNSISEHMLLPSSRFSFLSEYFLDWLSNRIQICRYRTSHLTCDGLCKSCQSALEST